MNAPTPALPVAPRPPAGAYALRVALVFGDTVLAERTISDRQRVTVGHRPDCTFILPTTGGMKAGRVVLFDKGQLQVADELAGRLHLGGTPRTLEALRGAGTTAVAFQPEDWGVVYLRHAPWVRLVVQRVQREVLPPLPRDRSAGPLLLTTLLSAVAFAVLITVAFLSYDPDRPDLKLDDIDERFSRAMFNEPKEEIPPPEEETETEDSKDEHDAAKARKRARGEEGRFGMKDRTSESKIIPKGPETGNVGNVGVVKELNALSQSDRMADLLSVGDQIGGLPSGEIVIGGGNYGMSTKGGGGGGGGEGEGEIMGTSDVDVGGGGSASRKRGVTKAKGPKEKQVELTTGTPAVRGQLSPELINKEVRRHRSQIRFCYQKQLTRFPNLKGKVTLAWVIGMDGSVKKAKVKSSSLGNKDAESCMVRALSGWTFPKPQGGVVSVDAYPFIFGTS
jgi:hypothetical protein